MGVESGLLGRVDENFRDLAARGDQELSRTVGEAVAELVGEGGRSERDARSVEITLCELELRSRELDIGCLCMRGSVRSCAGEQRGKTHSCAFVRGLRQGSACGRSRGLSGGEEQGQRETGALVRAWTGPP